MYAKLFSKLQRGGVTILDGAVGSELQRRGADMVGHKAWAALVTERNPEIVQRLHLDYISSGASIITANTFPCSKEMLDPLNLGHKFQSLNFRAIELACEAREITGKEILVAGSMTPVRVGDLSTLSPKFKTIQQFEEESEEMATIHKSAGADLILAEMLCDPVYSSALLRGVARSGIPIWAGLSTREMEDGSLGTFATKNYRFEDVIPEIVHSVKCDVMGIMHTKSNLISSAMESLKKEYRGITIVYPDCLPKRKVAGSMVDIASVRDLIDSEGAEMFVRDCEQWKNSFGVQIFGGCCGVPPEHIKALSRALKEIECAF